MNVTVEHLCKASLQRNLCPYMARSSHQFMFTIDVFLLPNSTTRLPTRYVNMNTEQNTQVCVCLGIYHTADLALSYLLHIMYVLHYNQPFSKACGCVLMVFPIFQTTTVLRSFPYSMKIYLQTPDLNLGCLR